MGDGKPSLSGHMAQCLHRAIRSAEKMNALGEAIMNPVIIGEYVFTNVHMDFYWVSRPYYAKIPSGFYVQVSI